MNLAVSYKLNMPLSYDTSVTFLDIYPRELTICVHTKNMYIAVLSTFICKVPQWK